MNILIPPHILCCDCQLCLLRGVANYDSRHKRRFVRNKGGIGKGSFIDSGCLDYLGD